MKIRLQELIAQLNKLPDPDEWYRSHGKYRPFTIILLPHFEMDISNAEHQTTTTIARVTATLQPSSFRGYEFTQQWEWELDTREMV
jgi:hypothetical protein